MAAPSVRGGMQPLVEACLRLRPGLLEVASPISFTACLKLRTLSGLRAHGWCFAVQGYRACGGGAECSGKAVVVPSVWGGIKPLVEACLRLRPGLLEAASPISFTASKSNIRDSGGLFLALKPRKPLPEPVQVILEAFRQCCLPGFKPRKPSLEPVQMTL